MVQFELTHVIATSPPRGVWTLISGINACNRLWKNLWRTREQLERSGGVAKLVDVAEYILAKAGPMSAMKLQKLVYYSQAWHVTWAERPLFENEIQAWANGPVAPDLYAIHRGRFIVEPGSFGGRTDGLSADEADSIDRVLDAYGDKSPQWLSDLTHMEPPWADARAGLVPGARGSSPISLAAMAEYYGAL
jgi:uncharacterized phage-associated protein